MKIEIRKLRKGETDFELLWGGVALAVSVLFLLWYKLSLPTPDCLFRALTGIPCATCGATRGLFALFQGQWLTALRWNPLCFLAEGSAGLFLLYAACVVIFRLPRVRVGEIGKSEAFVIRLCVVLLFAGNWVYVIFSKSRQG